LDFNYNFACFLININHPIIRDNKNRISNSGPVFTFVASSYKYLHSLLGFGLLFFSIYINYYLRDNSLLLAKQLGYFILAMVALQIFLGELMVFFDLPQLTRLFHTWGSSWLVGVIIILYNCIKNE